MNDPDNVNLPIPQSRSTDGLCGCRQCLRDRGDGHRELGAFWPTETFRMILCPTCGNKRCPHATDHRHACTGSNAPGQPGSAYAECKPYNV